ncbi:LysR family transcriptional regulator ArgP [Aliikangiella coralliicola]|uniref:LysR family transcriptional regulator ArgP n=1 Tax=Aliikangiella coralliicola TaxID=2592383 RepID=A0A545UCM8_9GAMM|nr:LysR family transcriptional regulator ArgP [Aliikangiella coralliicola]
MDYKLLRALDVVMGYQSFERAAKVLCISQSAVSQRIRLLEEYVGHPVIIRGKPLSLTSMGKQLINHFKQVEILEQELLPKIRPELRQAPIKLSLAVNADSLAIWFFDALAPLIKFSAIELNILISGETRTVERLKSGEAFGAVSTNPNPTPGFKTEKLGRLKYVLVATPEFKQHYFPKGVNVDSVRNAPGASFDRFDLMHQQFIEKHFGLPVDSYPCHSVRSSEAFVNMAKKSLAYTLIPEIQIQQELASGELVKIAPRKNQVDTLYWHSWVLEKGIFKQASKMIVEYARKTLL